MHQDIPPIVLSDPMPTLLRSNYYLVHPLSRDPSLCLTIISFQVKMLRPLTVLYGPLRSFTAPYGLLQLSTALASIGSKTLSAFGFY